ncbi:hypothetical protein [Streptomyces sp. NPDC048643]|uniref:hypothetical protein n=1 Tax=Streptomyces sp. NPDC048643 TaxID=3155637 RepID=UPI00341AE6AD
MNHRDTAQEEPAEHHRFMAYLSALEQVTDAEEADMLGKFLTDPDQTMAQSAVLRHLDRRAAELHPGPAYESWAEMVTRATTRHPLLAQRLREWSLFRAVALGQPWEPDALLGASNWLQLKTAAASDAPALELLADGGRTKRVRNTARTNIQQDRSP